MHIRCQGTGELGLGGISPAQEDGSRGCANLHPCTSDSPAHARPWAEPHCRQCPSRPCGVSQRGLWCPGPQLEPALWTPNIWQLASGIMDGARVEKPLENASVWSPARGPKPGSAPPPHTHTPTHEEKNVNECKKNHVLPWEAGWADPVLSRDVVSAGEGSPPSLICSLGTIQTR